MLIFTGRPWHFRRDAQPAIQPVGWLGWLANQLDHQRGTIYTTTCSVALFEQRMTCFKDLTNWHASTVTHQRIANLCSAAGRPLLRLPLAFGCWRRDLLSRRCEPEFRVVDATRISRPWRQPEFIWTRQDSHSWHVDRWIAIFLELAAFVADLWGRYGAELSKEKALLFIVWVKQMLNDTVLLCLNAEPTVYKSDTVFLRCKANNT